MIGILDSGSGGLTVMKAIREQLPSSDIVYFGDIKNAPYGSKTQRELSTLTAQAMLLLKERKAERIVSACNSVSASLAVSLLDVFAIAPGQLVEMVGPTVGYFRNVDKRIALCATPATVAAGMYENAFHMIGKEPLSIPMPDLAAAIEFGASVADIKSIIEHTLAPFAGQFDVLILACTHYPLVQNIFAEVLGPDIMLFDPAEAVAARAKQLFWPQEVAFGTTHFIISKESEHFREYVRKLFPTLIYTIEVLP
jgi:glutamate racemase